MVTAPAAGEQGRGEDGGNLRVPPAGRSAGCVACCPAWQVAPCHGAVGVAELKSSPRGAIMGSWHARACPGPNTNTKRQRRVVRGPAFGRSVGVLPSAMTRPRARVVLQRTEASVPFRGLLGDVCGPFLFDGAFSKEDEKVHRMSSFVSSSNYPPQT